MVFNPMTPTKAMILAARRVEYDDYAKGRVLTGEMLISTPDVVIKVMLATELQLVEMVRSHSVKQSSVVYVP